MAQTGFAVAEDSWLTSGAAPGISLTQIHVAGLDIKETGVAPVYWRPVEAQEKFTGVRTAERYTGLEVFFHNTVVTTPTSVSMITATAQSVECVFHQPGTMLTGSLRLRDLDLPPITFGANTWTTPGWELVPTLSPHLAGSIAEIEAVIRDMRSLKAIVRSGTLIRLAERAATKAVRAEEDLEAWARKLTDDVQDAND